MKHSQLIFSLLGLLFLALSSHAEAQSPFTFSTFDVPGATGGTEINDIQGNNLIGDYVDGAGRHGFVYKGSFYTYLNDPLATKGTAAASMDGNNIVGTYSNSTGLGTHGFIYNGTSYQTIDDPLAQVYGTSASGISSQTVVGWYRDANSIGHGFLYNINTQVFTTLDVPNATGGTYLFGISGSTLYGTYYDGAGEHGFVDSNGIFSTINFPSASSTEVFRGSNGSFIGGYNQVSASHCFLFDGANYVSFDVPGAQNGLTFPGGVSGNNIVGSYVDKNYIVHGFEATYAPPVDSDTPVMPPWLMVFLAGLLVLVASRRLPQRS